MSCVEPQRKDGVGRGNETVERHAECECLGDPQWGPGTEDRRRAPGCCSFLKPSDASQGHHSAPRPITFEAADKFPNGTEPPLPSATSRWAILDGAAPWDDGYSPGELSTGESE